MRADRLAVVGDCAVQITFLAPGTAASGTRTCQVEFIVNLKTAQSLGLTVPSGVLSIATR